MEELPSFLKRCYRFPRWIEERHWCSPSRRRHRVLGRAFQVSVSFQALLEEEADSAERLVDFLDASYECDSSEDYGENEHPSSEDEDDPDYSCYYDKQSCKIIWLSDDVFITANKNSTVSRLAEGLDHSTDKAYTIAFHSDLAGFWIVYQPSIAAERAHTMEPDTQELPRLVDVMDLILTLLARHKNVTYLTIDSEIKGNDSDNAHFPASHDALKAFVGEAQCERSIRMQDAGLSLEQWHMVISNCNKNVSIGINYSTKSSSSALETVILHHCPANLDLLGFHKAPPEKRQMVLTALETTTSLKELYLSFEDWNKHTFLLSMNAISRNRSITSLGLYLSDETTGPLDDQLTLEEWELIVCPAIACHPTLQKVNVCLDQSWRNRIFIPSPEKDGILIKMLLQNTLLVKFDMERPNFLTRGMLEDKQKFDSAVKPVLECNRFRQVVQAIKHETNIEYRKQLFAATLVSDRVCRHREYRYLLLKENFDLLKQSSSIIEGILLSDWEMTVRQLRSLENRKQSLETRMRDRGVTIPKSLWEDEDDIHLLHRKKSKRSRSS